MPRPAVVRYGGLAGSLALAAAAWLGGATDPWQPTITPGTIFAGDNGVLLPLAWLAGTGLLIAAWVAGVRSAPTARWAYVTAVLWMLPLLAFLPLGSYDAYSYACQGWQQSAGLDPYGGGVDVLGCPWADAVAPTWRDAPAPYGPLFLVLAGVAAQTGSLTVTLAGLRVIALLGIALIAVALPTLARRGGVPPGRAVWLVLACPLVPIHLVSGAHNDALMVGLVAAGLALAIRANPAGSAASAGFAASADSATSAGRGAGAVADSGETIRATGRRADLAGWAAGLLLGLAIAVKATALVVVPFALLLMIERYPQFRGASPGPVDSREVSSAQRRKFGPRPWWLGPVIRVVAGALVGLAAASLVSGRGFGWVTALSGSGKSVQWTSPPTAVGMAIGLFGPDAVPVTRVLGIVALAFVLVVLWWKARDNNPLRYAGYALAATVLLAPVFHPWYALWPLAILAATLHTHLNWLVVPCAVVSALCLPDGYNLALAVKTQGAVAMTVFLVWIVVHEAKIRSAGRRRADHVADRLSGPDA
ncbi:polyprenol phosphomannose-dependent alpha 1,6 mannosyltransferase MptB [Paractinoplanes abujensis]|uniref:Alpha-1,6-mannosyltransferase n=1 Tax=Paractinoplanes abujensis TaxID=882441 RepID=A0A7W7G341_9ACTN|nr:polyprenol phosphomannose-dependent alpha 1,6 mannosyltransferase MptB [Actinoplanes abujensis]MBB4694477.1 alpha-1,6-mannosyltransferase [Actinoplanes abujensis]